MSFKICSIGCGEHATKVHGPSCALYASRNPGVELAACCDLNPGRAEAFRRSFGYRKGYTDMAEMLDREHPDAVCLVVAPEHTAALAEKILRRGIPLLMEKPPGLKAAETRGLIETARRNRVPHMVAFNRRFCPLVAELKNRLSFSFTPDQIHSLEYTMVRFDRRDQDFSTTLIHAVDAVRFLAGSPYREARLGYRSLASLGPGVANMSLEAVFASGAEGRITAYPMAGVVLERCIIHLHNHTFILELPMWNAFDFPGTMEHLEGGVLKQRLSGAELCPEGEVFLSGGFYAENAAFFDDIRAGRIPEADLESSLQSVDISEYARQRKNVYP